MEAICNSPSAKKWPNILGLVQLLFCLPVSNGHVEQVFSQLKIIKTERRTELAENRLDSLLRIATSGSNMSNWDPTHAMNLWWK